MNTKLKCLLLDDELPGLTYLKMLCEQIPELEVVRAFNNPVTLLSEMESLDFDICILDIEMPEMDGLHVAELLGGRPVIFTTAYKEYAAEAFDLNAVDYVRKPVRKERLQQAVQKAIQRIEKDSPRKNFLQVNTDKGKAVLHFDQIAYIKTAETDSRDKWMRLADGSSLVVKNMTFGKLTTLLPEAQFCRINRQEMIAMSYIQFFSHDEITTSLSVNGKPLVLNLSDTCRNEFTRKVNF